MEVYQEKAWEILTEKERIALHLHLSQGLSVRQMSLSMGMREYKATEMLRRAEKFFKMFSDFFQIHSSIFSPNPALSDHFKDYMEALIEKRLIRREASFYAGDKKYYINKIRNDEVLHNMKKLKNSKDKWDKDTFALIVEFDRWNNNRILPTLLQAPSAYKRRKLKKHERYIKYLLTLHEKRIKQIIEYYYNNSHEKRLKRYIVLFSTKLFPPKNFCIVPFRLNNNNKEQPLISLFSNHLRLLIFKEFDDAELYGLLVSQYLEYQVSDPKYFWKTYWDIVSKAENRDSILNTDFTPTDLDAAYNIKRKDRKESHLIKSRKKKEIDEITL